ncbi:EF-hand calcium-binding domain-containing protein 6 isoform X5 [Fukomys damarensis]|uniref:EF-hand calcium-binding domain-containing protein 6 isoform X5 n=1 Tax=Fukomys damarensis TaxID=885580 RepID=UPI001455CC84|nr:EF-hand calcium-binding domain-containing protein 6 isoform X5 [Fukomys damarensis]
MKRNSTKGNSTKSGSTKARNLMNKMMNTPDGRALYPRTRKFTRSRPHSSPCRVYSKDGFRNTFRPSSSPSAAANPILSFLDVKQILFQKITDRRDELKKAFQLLDVGQNLAVTRRELRRIVTTFLLPLTKEQFQDVLAQIPLTSSGNVPYLEFLSRFGGIDLNINAIKRGGRDEVNCCRTLKELEIQVGQKVFRNLKTIIKAFQLVDVNNTGLVQPQELMRVLETFCLKMTEEEYRKAPRRAVGLATPEPTLPFPPWHHAFHWVVPGHSGVTTSLGAISPELAVNMVYVDQGKRNAETEARFSKHYNIDKDAAVDYNMFLKNLSISNDLHLRYFMWNQEVSPENQQAKTLKREQSLDSAPFEESWNNYSLDDVERVFCQEFSKSVEKIEKALSAGDPSRGGYVSLNYLKVVLDTFVYRLPRRTFLQLMKSKVKRVMESALIPAVLPSCQCFVSSASDSTVPVCLSERFGFKTTTRINWKQFLTSFYELQGLENSNIVPPLKRDRNQSCGENVITKLLRHAEDSYGFLKKGLLMNSTSEPDRQITGEELRQILSSTVMKLKDSEFKELMSTLDPGGTGAVKVSSFIDLLEASPKMRQMPPRTGAKTSLLPAWDSVEETVHRAIAKNLRAFYNMLQSYDLGDSGFVARNNFKRVMRIFCPFLTNEHLIKLCCKFQDTTSEKILYKKFLSCIRINGPPTVSPLLVPKDQPNECFQKGEEQQPVLSERTKPTSDRTATTKNMSKEEVIEKLKSCVKRQDPAFRNCFLDVSKDLHGKISMRDFKKVLEDCGMPMDQVHFALLATKIGCKKEGMSYLDFVTGLEDTKTSGLAATPPQTPVSSKIHLNGHFITAEECLKLFPKRLKASFRDPYSAFFKIDTDRDGIVNMRDLHRLLQRLLFNLKDEEFERFLGLLGLRLSVTLNFREFQNLCEKRSPQMDEAPQRLIRPKQKVADSELACEQAHQYLVIKAKNRWADLSKNFIETDTEGNGILRPRDIKNALYGFDVPLTPREFEKLWQSYDTEGRGCITYQEFLQKLGINYSPAVHRPYAEDDFNPLGRFTKPQQVQEEIQELQQSIERAVPARDQLMGHCQDISKALSALDKSQSGSVPLCKMQQVLQECGCPLKEEELTGLLHSLGIICHDNAINYLDFLRALENSKTTRPQPKEKEESVPISFSTLSPEEVVKNIQEVVSSSHPALLQTFSALDKEDTGFIKATDFGQVLKDLCYNLTDSQYHYFLRKLRIHLTPYIHWKYFLENFGCFLEETADEWAGKMPRVPPPASPQEVANRDLLARLHKAVTSHYHAIAQEFENFDTNKTNTASRDEFRAICTRHVQILTDKQFDRLWSKMPVNDKGRLKYQEFLSRFGPERAATPPATGDSARAQRGSSVPEISEGTRSSAVSPSTHDPRAGLKSRSHPCSSCTSSAWM